MGGKKTPKQMDYECELYSISTDWSGKRVLYVECWTWHGDEIDEGYPYRLQAPMYHVVFPLPDVIKIFRDEGAKEGYGTFHDWVIDSVEERAGGGYGSFEIEDLTEEGVEAAWKGHDSSNYLPLENLRIDTPDGTYWY